MMKHTPGPWITFVDEDEFDSSHTIMRVIDGSAASLEHPQGPITIATVNVAAHAPHLAEPTANLRLIAAAADLLVALQRLLERASKQMDTSFNHEGLQNLDAIVAARAAIAKATGG